MSSGTKIRSVHLVATGRVWIAGSPGKMGDVDFEYWAQGDHYLIKSQTAQNLGFGGDMEIAFDGEQWQMLTYASRTLHIQRSPSKQVPTALPNPLFLPLEFLGANGYDACPLCRIHLHQIASHPAWNRKSLGPLPLAANAAVASTTYRLAGANVEGEQAFYDVAFQSLSGSVVPVSIALVLKGARVLEITTGHFEIQDSAVGPLPTEESIRVFRPDGVKVMDTAFTIETLEVNILIPESRFTIDRARVKAVWDSDANMFVKHPNKNVVGRPLGKRPDELGLRPPE